MKKKLKSTDRSRKTKSSPVGLERFARLTQDEFTVVHKEISHVRGEMHEGFDGLRTEMRSGFRDVIAAVEALSDVEELRHRIERIEKKVGLNS